MPGPVGEFSKPAFGISSIFSNTVIFILQRSPIGDGSWACCSHVVRCGDIFWNRFLGGLCTCFIQYGKCLPAYLLQGNTEVVQHSGCNPFALAHQTQEEMLGSNIMMVHAASLVNRQLNYLFSTWRETNLAQNDTITAPNNIIDRIPHSR